LTHVDVPLVSAARSQAHYDLAILDVNDRPSPLELMAAAPARHYAFFPRCASPLELPSLSVLMDYRTGGYEAADNSRNGGAGIWWCQPSIDAAQRAVAGCCRGWSNGRKESGALSMAVDLTTDETCAPETRELLARGKVDGLFGTSDANVGQITVQGSLTCTNLYFLDGIGTLTVAAAS